jgi:hypothetical protein
MAETEVNNFIDELHFKTFDKVWPAVKEQFPEITKDELRDILKKRVKDPYRMEKKNRKYQVKIFSQSPDTWFHDIFDNTTEGNPRYFHVFIGTNSRYAVVKPLRNKNASSVLETIRSFVEEFEPVKLTSDEEAAFKSETILSYLESKEVLVMFVEDKNHTTLGIIDRFTRTIRDLNTPRESSTKQSHDKEFRVFTNEKMQKLVNIYNNSEHSSIGCTPKEMHNDFDLEKEYILDCLKKRDKQKNKVEDFELNEGDFVRYILPRHDGISKKRHRLSPEMYKIEERVGVMYSLIAADGSVITKPRHKLVKAHSRQKFAETIPGKNTGSVKQILGTEGQNKYRVLFTVPGQPDYPDTITKRMLRGRFPTIKSQIEVEYENS